MKKRLGKKGQFYLVAAIVLAAVIIGISAVSNYAKREKNTGLYDLREEIRIESEKTIDYGTKSNFNRAQMTSLYSNFINNYTNYEGSTGKNLYFLYGDRSNITLSGIQREDVTVTIVSGGSTLVVTNNAGTFSGSMDPALNSITLYLDEDAYDFELSPAENFYFVISQGISGGDYVVQG